MLNNGSLKILMSINNSTQLDELFGKVYPITIQITILRSITEVIFILETVSCML